MKSILGLAGVGFCLITLAGWQVGDADTAPAIGRPLLAQTSSAPPASDVAARLARRLAELMEDAAVPGVQLALVRDGAIAGSGTFGVANADTRTPVTDASVFEAASLSKPMFAYAVLKLVDAGRLDLDAPVTTYLPGPYDFADDERLGRITARHVLSHQTGLPNWRPGNQPLKIHFAPGERFSYSGEGFVYLAAAIERITGETLEAFMKRIVFDPLEMRSSSYVWQARFEPLKVYSHGPIGNQVGRRQPWRANAAASLHTTARDYATFVCAVINGVGLQPSTARLLRTPQAGLDEAGFNTATVPPTGRLVPSLAWGLGWGLERDGDDWFLWHWGDNGPTKAYVFVSPARKTGLVVFLNGENGLAIVPPLLAEALGVQTSALEWLKQRPLTPAFSRFVRAVRQGDVARALAEYREAREAKPDEAALSEETLNRVGYALLREKKVKDAIEVFLQNVADHPGSWNVHDSLGEAYAADGDTERAIAAYERSLKLNPNNSGGAEALKKLRGSDPP